MSIEIERKFLVNGNFKHLVKSKKVIKQGYISTDPKRTVRIRIKDTKAFITIKGAGNKSGMSRYEWEKEIDFNEGVELLELCDKPIIDKIRYMVEFENHTFEIDEFFGDNKGLIIAEVELQSEHEQVKLPGFIGKEVTNELIYYNAYLSQHPFITWK